MKIDSKCVWAGTAAGALAATALIVLFFFLDVAHGTPLATPTFLSGALLGRDGLEASSLLIALYTVAHYGVFMVLGVVAAVAFDLTGIPRNLLIGAAYGLFSCSLVFYPALLITGTDILAAPAWPAVFFGNVLAGVIIVAYLHWAGPETGVVGLWAQLRAHPAVREGIVAGLLGAGIVAVWFLIVDSVAGRPLFTPAALGSAVLFGASAAEGVRVTASTVIGYSLIHVAGFLVFGLVVSGLVTQAEKVPPLVFGLILLFVVFETFFVFMVAMLGSWLLESLAWWSVLVGNLLAAAAIGAYMWWKHPGLREELRSDVLWAPR
ncbi:MAG: hypothetical protein ACE5HF_04880 [Gemmatimonadota bacterium]